MRVPGAEGGSGRRSVSSACCFPGPAPAQTSPPRPLLKPSPVSQRPRLRAADPDVSELLALVLRAAAPKSSTGSQLCASGDLRCEIKRCSLLSGVVL